MSETVFVIGIDPGPVTGVVLLDLEARSPGDGAQIFQCNAAAAPWLLASLLAARSDGEQGYCGIEGFAPGRGPGARMHGGQVTRILIEELTGICKEYGIPVTARYAAEVKPWATDRRLAACGLTGLTAGSTHARDAARHAIYCAHWDCGYPDPLGKAAP